MTEPEMAFDSEGQKKAYQEEQNRRETQTATIVASWLYEVQAHLQTVSAMTGLAIANPQVRKHLLREVWGRLKQSEALLSRVATVRWCQQCDQTGQIKDERYGGMTTCYTCHGTKVVGVDHPSQSGGNPFES